MVKIEYVDMSIEVLDEDWVNLIVNTGIQFEKRETAVDWKLYVKFWEHDKIFKDDSIGPKTEDLVPHILKPRLPDRQPPPERFLIHKRVIYKFPKSQLNKDIGDEEIYVDLRITPNLDESEDTARSSYASFDKNI